MMDLGSNETIEQSKSPSPARNVEESEAAAISDDVVAEESEVEDEEDGGQKRKRLSEGGAAPSTPTKAAVSSPAIVQSTKKARQEASPARSKSPVTNKVCCVSQISSRIDSNCSSGCITCSCSFALPCCFGVACSTRSASP